jgi:hypothetical protein
VTANAGTAGSEDKTMTLLESHDTLLRQQQREAAAERAAALKSYRELLDREHAPQPGDVDELRRVMGVLGIDAAAVRQDLNDLYHARRAAAEVMTPGQARKAYDDKAAAEAGVVADFRKALRDMVDAVDPLALPHAFDWLSSAAHGDGKWYDSRDKAAWLQRSVAAQCDYTNAVTRSREAQANYDRITKGNPRVFGDAAGR